MPSSRVQRYEWDMNVKLQVNVDVPDLEAAIRFYRDAFGLRLSRRFDGFVELLGAGVPIYLLEKAQGSPPFEASPAVRHYTRHWMPVHCDLIVDDLDAALERALAAGAFESGGVSEHDYGRMARLADPFGHGFCLIEFRSQGYALPAVPTA